MGEEFDEGACGFLGLGVVAGGAAYPVENVGVGVFVGGFDVEAVGPGQALLVVDAPWVLGALHAAEGRLELAGELAFDHDLVAADVDDVEHLLVLRGADLHAGSAGGAGPGGFGREGELEERAWAGGIFFEGGCGEAEGASLGGEVVELHALVDLKRGGREGFAGGGGWADVLTAVALDASVGVEEARPGEVFEFVGADGFGGFIFGFVLDVEVEGYGRENAGGGFAFDEVLGGRHEDVNVFGVGEVG